MARKICGYGCHYLRKNKEDNGMYCTLVRQLAPMGGECPYRLTL